MDQIIKANLVWFVTFAIGIFLTYLSYGYEAPHYILFVFGMFILSVGSIFAGHIASK